MTTHALAQPSCSVTDVCWGVDGSCVASASCDQTTRIFAAVQAPVVEGGMRVCGRGCVGVCMCSSFCVASASCDQTTRIFAAVQAPVVEGGLRVCGRGCVGVYV